MTNTDQATFWTEEAGPKWVRHQVAMDALLAPVTELVLSHAGLVPGMGVVDIGCGAGASTRAAAARVAPGGRVLGVDVSDTLLEAARAQGGADYLKSDAQSDDFVDFSFDAAISRFGVMFFDDTAAALANIARALRPGARATFAAWGPAPQNPFFLIPAGVARDHFGPQPKTDRTLPGPFAWEDASRVTGFFAAAGWGDVTVTPVPLTLDALDADAMADLALAIGPAEAALRRENGGAEDARALRERLLAAYAPTGGAVTAVINLVQARTP